MALAEPRQHQDRRADRLDELARRLERVLSPLTCNALRDLSRVALLAVRAEDLRGCPLARSFTSSRAETSAVGSIRMSAARPTRTRSRAPAGQLMLSRHRGRRGSRRRLGRCRRIVRGHRRSRRPGTAPSHLRAALERLEVRLDARVAVAVQDDLALALEVLREHGGMPAGPRRLRRPPCLPAARRAGAEPPRRGLGHDQSRLAAALRQHAPALPFDLVELPPGLPIPDLR